MGIPTLTQKVYNEKGTDNLINVGPVFNSGIYLFDNAGDYVELPTRSFINKSGNYSFSIWVNYTNKSNDEGQILQNSLSSSNRVGMFIKQTGTVAFGSYNGSSYESVSGNLSLYNWHHIFVMDNYTTKRLFIDGIEWKENISTSIGQTSSYLYIGRNIGGNKDNFEGEIDEIRIYNSTLSESQIIEINNSGRNSNLSLPSNNLVDYFSFNTPGIIEISGVGDINMTFINYTINNSKVINNTESKQYTLFADLNITSSLLNVSFTSYDLTRLRMYSSSDYWTKIVSNNFSYVNFTNLTIDSFNGSDYDKNEVDGRAFIYLLGDNLNSKVYVYNSNISYLGNHSGRSNGFLIQQCHNSKIYNNYFYELGNGIESRQSDYVNIINNTIFSIDSAEGADEDKGIVLQSSDYNRIINNTIFDTRGNGTVSIWGSGCEGTIVESNNISNGRNGVLFYDANRNITISNNLAYDLDKDAYRFEGQNENCNIINNTAYDFGMLGPSEEGAAVHQFNGMSINLTINNNVFYRGYRGIIIVSGNNVTSRNNYLYRINGSTTFSINSVNMFLLENLTIYNSSRAIRLDNSSNGSINNLILSSNNSIDLDFYGNNSDINFNNIYLNSGSITYNSISSGTLQENISFNNFLGYNFNMISAYRTNFTITNATSPFLGSNSFFHNGTSICNGSSSNINSNTGQINITLSPGENCTVLDSYNITEGVTRQNDPIWFNSITTQNNGRVYHIASNLTDTIYPSVYINSHMDCERLTVEYTPNGGNTITPPYTCSNGIITLNNLEIRTSSDSNILLIANEYTSGICDNLFSAYPEFFKYAPIMFGFLAAALIIIIIGGLVYIILNPESISNFHWGIGSIGITIFFVSMMIIAIMSLVSIIILDKMCAI